MINISHIQMLTTSTIKWKLENNTLAWTLQTRSRRKGERNKEKSWTHENKLHTKKLHCSSKVYGCLVSESYIPIGRGNIPSNDGLLCSVRCDLEGEWLTPQCCKSLVWCTPIVAHADPPTLAPFHPHTPNVSSSPYIHHIHKQPVPIPLETESDSVALDARHPDMRQNHVRLSAIVI